MSAGAGGESTPARREPAKRCTENPNSSGWAGYFDGKVHTTASYSSSDIRLKKDVYDLPYGIAQVLKLRPVTFKWKEGNDQTQLGVIAQDLQKVIPEVVQADAKSGMLSVNYPALVPVMLKAIQEQQKLLQQQEERISALERNRAPTKSSMFSGGIGTGFLLALLPVGILVTLRRRRDLRS